MRLARHPPVPRRGTESDAVARRVAAFVVDQLLVIGLLTAVASWVLGVGAGALGLGVEIQLFDDPLKSVFGGTSAETAVAVGAALFGVGATATMFAYFTLMEGAFGRTVGKLLFGLVVVRTDGSAIGYREAFVRTALRAVDSLPSLYLLGFGSMLASDRRQRIGDRVAGTVVVEAETPASAGGESATGTPA
ncbi:RDD family protein [Halosimplex amylolyticum]|uniref:RDD family protein n=1 Tax=Halosimplex amylolyticum TaxID=3396616 RepID=UPI003F5571AA